MRTVLGWKPSNDPKADELRNSNMPQPTDQMMDPSMMPAMDQGYDEAAVEGENAESYQEENSEDTSDLPIFQRKLTDLDNY
jgi:hypothetical protein